MHAENVHTGHSCVAYGSESDKTVEDFTLYFEDRRTVRQSLRDQGLSQQNLNIVYNSLILSRLQ